MLWPVQCDARPTSPEVERALFLTVAPCPPTQGDDMKGPPQRGVNARGSTRFYSKHSGYCLCEYLVWSTRSQYASNVEEHRVGVGSVASDSKIEIKRSEFSGLPGQVGRDAARVGRTRNPDLRGTIPGR